MRYVLVYPFVFVVSCLMWLFRADEYTYKQFEHNLDRFEDMLDNDYPTGTVPTIIVSTLAGFSVAGLFGNDLPAHGEHNFATFVQIGAIMGAVVLFLCMFAIGHVIEQYCTTVNYTPDENLYRMWWLAFSSSLMSSMFGLGYFIIPALI